MELTHWLSLGQAARRLGVSPQMVDVYCRTGKLTFVSTPLGRLIDPANVERLAKEREAQRKGVGVA
jgi:predicted site-specific integrase-resolvase